MHNIVLCMVLQELLARSIIESALERTLRVGVRRRQWIKLLLVAILSR